MGTGKRAIGYGRVSTAEQAASGYGLDAQADTIRSEATRRGWELVDLVLDEGESGKSLDRPGVLDLLGRLGAGEADVLVVSKLDRLTRSLVDLAELLDWTERAGVALVAVDLGIDTTTSAGRLVARVMASVAEWEREQIAQRTREAATVRREQGKRMGRPGVRDTRPDLAARIDGMRAAGRTWQAIADALNTEGVPTVRGGSVWRVSAVQSAAGYVRPPAHAGRVALPDVPKRRRVRV